MRHKRANVSGDRSNALWGRGSRNELRSNALWGRGGRRAGAAVATLVLSFAFMAAAAVADNGGSNSGSSSSQSKFKAYFEPSLLSAIQQNPSQTFDVIVMGDKQGNSNGLFKKLVSDSGSGSAVNIGAGSLKDQFNSINGLHSDAARLRDPEGRPTELRLGDPGQRVGQDVCGSAAAHELAAVAVGDRRSDRTG